VHLLHRTVRAKLHVVEIFYFGSRIVTILIEDQIPDRK